MTWNGENVKNKVTFLCVQLARLFGGETVNNNLFSFHFFWGRSQVTSFKNGIFRSLFSYLYKLFKMSRRSGTP